MHFQSGLHGEFLFANSADIIGLWEKTCGAKRNKSKVLISPEILRKLNLILIKKGIAAHVDLNAYANQCLKLNKEIKKLNLSQEEMDRFNNYALELIRKAYHFAKHRFLGAQEETPLSQPKPLY